jgi:hypothetical protein
MRKLLVCLLLAVAARATEVTDLGQGLGYLRLHDLTGAGAALAKVVPESRALVLDLRYATGDEKSAAVVAAALAARPAGAQLFVLVSPATPAALAPALASALTLGAPGSSPTPKIVVRTDAGTDRRAYEALDTGTPLADLISGRIEKERYDEASLVDDFNHGDRDAEPPPGPDPTAAKPGDQPAATKLVDRVLQRAVHLHRALLALRG